jgi:hypothetical protein
MTEVPYFDPKTAYSLFDAMGRFNRGDPTLEKIDLVGNQYTDQELAVLVDYLLAHPNAVISVLLTHNRLTDETGIKLARYVAASSTIQELILPLNHLGSVTYLGMATALCVNTSLRSLSMYSNLKSDGSRITAEERRCIDDAFINALVINSNRPARSSWWIYYIATDEYERLKTVARQMGHPSLQTMLTTRVFGVLTY